VTQTTELWTAWTARRDERAFETLVRPELPHALGFARRLGCGAADAEDALQDALARLASTKDDAPAAIGVRAWLFRAVHSAARSRLRSDRRRRARESSVAVADAHVGDAAAVAVRDELERALAELDDDERVAVELRHLHDLDYVEMALIVGASEGACRQRVSKALARLRARFGEEAAALVAALPLPAAPDASSTIRAALANSKTRAPAAKGATIVTTPAQTLVLTAAVAAALGVAGTLAAQRATSVAPTPTVDVGASTDPRDVEIAKLRTRLAEAQRRGSPGRNAAASPGGVDATTTSTPDAADAEIASTTVQVAVMKPTAPPAKRTGEITDDIDAVKVMEYGAPWVHGIKRGDAAGRDAAWTSVRDALSSQEGVPLVAALHVIFETSNAKVDRAGVRELILPHLDASSPDVKLAAWAALVGNGSVTPADVDKLRGQIVDAPKELRIELLHRMNWATKGVFEGPNADVLLDAFSDPTIRWDVLMAIQKARLTDPVVAKILEYARTGPQAAEHAQFFVLAPLPDKNRDVVAFLIDRAERGDATALAKFEGTVRREDAEYAAGRLRGLVDDATRDAAVRAAAKSALQSLDRAAR
jgi:RNA polymerase sigma-70 factor (ECF subfamily)